MAIICACMHAFLLCGYGIPHDITQDPNYTSYLHQVFEIISQQAANQQALIIPSGGPTHCEPPFDLTEAEVMAEYFSYLSNRPEVAASTHLWRLVLEDQSLSTLENLLFTKKLLDHEQAIESITIFCEKTREQRMKIVAKKVFGPTALIHAIDFDTSKNRFLDADVIQRKEALALKEALWTLEDPTRAKRHHTLFQKKIDFLRKRQTEGLSHEDAVAQWFTQQEKLLRELMPDHPLLDEFTNNHTET